MRGKQSGRTDDEASAGVQPAMGRDLPPFLGLAVNNTLNASVAFDIALQVEFIRDEMEIPLDFRLAGEVFAPVPSVDQFLAEGVLIGIALRVEAGARITIPVPSTADIRAGLEYLRGKTQLAEFMEGIETRYAGTDPNGIIVLGHNKTPRRLPPGSNKR